MLPLHEDPRYAEVKRLSTFYELETGEQGLIHDANPGGPRKFVFGEKTCLGITQALAFARELGTRAEQHAAARQAAEHDTAQSMEDTT